MNVMNRTIHVIVATLLLGAVLAVIGTTLNFSGLAWMAGLVVAMLLVSLVDRPAFYGPRHH